MRERLRQLELVGCGAMAEVFRGALHGEHGTSRPVAIKRLRPDLRDDPAAVDLFVNEAKIAVRMHHPNVVHALELTRDDHGYALVCEWLDCSSLQELADRGHRLPPYAVVHVGRCLCNALSYLHGLTRDDGEPMGLVHRDVTPANVFLTQSGEVKLADFGVAWCKDNRDDTIAGTPEFAAPEQQTSTDIDARADIYGLGATLRAVADELPVDLAAVLERACAEDREARHSSARELSDALGQVSTELGSATAQHRLAELMAECRSDPATTSAPRLDGAVQSILSGALSDRGRGIKEITQPEGALPKRPRRWPLIALVTAPLVLAAVAGAYAWQRGQAEPTSEVDAAVPANPVEPTPGSVEPTPEPVAAIEPSNPRPAEPQPVEPGEPRPVEPDPEPDPAATPRKRPAVVARGVVSLNAVPWAKVKIDGRDVGNTPLKSIELTAGRHAVTLFNPAQKLRKEVLIEVDGNRTQTFLVNLRRGTVQKRIQP